jgi:LuxR family maltose regulon positive regulatory protein
LSGTGLAVGVGASFEPSFPLVESKLHPMIEPEGMVVRQRLLELLLREDGPRLISIVAPPGYGKTTLLTQWATRETRPVAWVTLDNQDNDPAKLAAYIAVSLGRIRPFAASFASALSGPPEGVAMTAIPRLASALDAWNTRAVLVLDDVHRLVDHDALRVVALLADQLPDGFEMIVAGRRPATLPLGSRRLHRTLLEIDAADLALDERETTLVAHTAGWTLDPAHARELMAGTEGWPAAIYLASLGGARVAGRAHVPSEGERYINEYLQAEVQDYLSDDDVALLTRTSVVETVTPGLARAITGSGDAETRLPALAARNLLVQQLAGSQLTYRYHKLLRRFLRSELDRREAGKAPVYHRRAAAWYLDAQAPEQAVEQLLAAGDDDSAARVLAPAALPLFYRGSGATVMRLIDRIDSPTLVRTPSLAVFAAWLFVMTGRPDDAFAMAGIAESADPAGASHTGATSLGSELAMLRVVLARHGVNEMVTDARLAVELEPSGSPWRPTALALLGGALCVAGDTEAADRWFAQAIDSGATSAATVMVSHSYAAGIAIGRGDWAAARLHLAACDASNPRGAYDGLIWSLGTRAIAARIAVHEGDHDAARAHLVAAQLLRPLASHAIPWFSVDALLHISRTYLTISDPAGAQQALREAEQIIRHRPALGTLTDEVVALRRVLEGAAITLAGSSSLTPAELRILQLLPTYLSFEEIGDWLSVSRNTVKTHAMAIYGKLWASSRSEAVNRAVELGLLEPYPVLRRDDTTRSHPHG